MTADRTLELMNEYQQTLTHESWYGFQPFLVVKIMRLEKKLADVEYCADNNLMHAQRLEKQLSIAMECDCIEGGEICGKCWGRFEDAGY